MSGAFFREYHLIFEEAEHFHGTEYPDRRFDQRPHAAKDHPVFLPLAASSILQLLFNAADVVVVGRFAGSTALAAVGSNGALINLLVNLFVGLSLGANVVAARCFGAKDDEGVHNTVQTSVTLGLVSGFLLAVVGFLPPASYWS